MGHAHQGSAGGGHPRSVALRGDRCRCSTTHGSSDVSAPDINLSSADLGPTSTGRTSPTVTPSSVSSRRPRPCWRCRRPPRHRQRLHRRLTIESPPAPNAFIQPRGLAFDSSGNLWVADQGHSRIDVFYANSSGLVNMDVAPTNTKEDREQRHGDCTSALHSLVPVAPPRPPTFDMRGLAIDPKSGLAFVANGQGCVVQEFQRRSG